MNTGFTALRRGGPSAGLTGRASFASNAAPGTRHTIGWGINGSTPTATAEHEYSPVASLEWHMETTYMTFLPAGHYVELYVAHNKGSNLSTSTGYVGVALLGTGGY